MVLDTLKKLKAPEEAYEWKLGAALTMEETVLDILDDSIEEAQDEKTRAAFEAHRRESESHVANVKDAFGALGWDVDDSPCPTIDGLKAEAKTNVKKTDDSLVDSILLQGAVEVEHHEIAVYENLIINAEAMGRQDVADILKRNLDNEEETLAKVKDLQHEVAAVTPKNPA